MTLHSSWPPGTGKNDAERQYIYIEKNENSPISARVFGIALYIWGAVVYVRAPVVFLSARSARNRGGCGRGGCVGHVKALGAG